MLRIKILSKKLITVALLIQLASTQTGLVFAANSVVTSQNPESSKGILHGNVQLDDENSQKNNIFTGGKEEVKGGTRLKMTVSTVLSSGYNQKGDEFFAEVTDDLATEQGILIPSGTIAHGKVTQLESSKRMGRDAYIKLDFDYLITPDGREIPIEASMTTKRHPVTSVGKVILEDAAITAAGGLIGGILALKFLGLGAAVASNGYTVAGGAGVGALVGATASVARKGSGVIISPGDEINVKIASKMELPVMTEEAFKDEEKLLEGLNVDVTSYKLEKDPFGELNTITLTLNIDNKTKQTFSSFDMSLVNDYKSVYYPSPFGNTDLWFHKIAPNEKVQGTLSFSVDNPKRKHWLVFYDSYSRKPLARISLKNVERKLKKEKSKK